MQAQCAATMPSMLAGAPAPESALAAALQAILDQAVLFHRAKRFREAAQLYGHILKCNPQHADSLHLLGMVASQAHMPALAIELIGKAIASNSHAAAYHSNLGTLLQAEGQLDEAKACYGRALALDPAMAEIHLNLGLVLQTQGWLDEAIAAYRKAVALNMDLPEAHSNLGNALQSQGQLDQAVAHYRRALALRPEFAEASYNLGNVLLAQEKLGEAAAAYEQALLLRPAFAEAHANLGNVLQAQQKPSEAQAHYEFALHLKPNYAEAHYNLGNLHAQQKRPEQAVAHFQAALRLDPDLAKAHNNLGNVFRSLERSAEAVAEYRQVPENDPEFTDAYNNLGLALLSLGRHEEAAQAIRRTLALKPHLAQAWCNLGAVYHAQNHNAEAVEYYQRALELDPALAKARLNLGLVQLVEGDLENGWKNYELRWDDAPLHRRAFAQPLWRGEPLNGARILLHAEQGYGDTLQFLRYVPMVQAAGGTVILEVQERLQRLAAELPGVAQVVCNGDELPNFDFHCPLLSLPLAFATTFETIPAQIPYLSVPAEAQMKARALPWPADGLRVGLIWAGKPSFDQDLYRNRSFPLALLRPLLEVEGAHFFSLQIGAPAAQLAENADLAAAIADLSPHVADMADTAAQIAHLDLLISADTAVAHLGAALGVPTWVLMPYAPDWRWLQERSDTPWYPKMRLFRQAKPGDWAGVVVKMREVLSDFCVLHRA
jgi:tetratricopeptide (TPR) repeat protein